MTRRFVTFTIALLAPFALLSISAAAPKAPEIHKVTIKNLKYDPPKLTIKAGETVEWTNKDDKDHTVTPDDPDAWGGKGSDNLGGGDTFQQKFDKKGKFGYHCQYHPRMKGVITVD